MTRRAKSGQTGFTLVELLVVVAIIGLLSAIAISQYALYKLKAVDASMEAALQSARQAMEGFYVENDTYAGATDVNIQSHGYRENPAVALTLSGLSNNTYVLRACANGGTTPAYTFDSSVGIMVASPCS